MASLQWKPVNASTSGFIQPEKNKAERADMISKDEQTIRPTRANNKSTMLDPSKVKRNTQAENETESRGLRYED